MPIATCHVVPSGPAYVGQQGFTYLTGLTGATTGALALCMTVVNLPDGARAKTHLHRAVETGAYIIEGEGEMYFGARLEQHLRFRAGDYVYIPSDMPHLVMNRSGAPCRALVAHTAPDDQFGIELLPHLDAIV
ncbi:MAG TPA: cupin domain-containing protein [Gemmatimonadales bacterium]|nr:cupin domain-containing protein [Gemmatimonadales bacterium]